MAYIKGVQSRGVGTSLKHFAVNNFETERFRASVEIDERTLREIYLPQFEMAVREAQPWTVMCSFNRINGLYASENGYLLTTILRDEWGFEGAVISDWGAVHNIHEPVKNISYDRVLKTVLEYQPERGVAPGLTVYGKILLPEFVHGIGIPLRYEAAQQCSESRLRSEFNHSVGAAVLFRRIQ